MGQHTLLHGEALLVVASADAHHITLQKVSRHFSGHTFWQPVAGNEMFSCNKVAIELLVDVQVSCLTPYRLTGR
uniref:Uncharacterized protein n=1 Tax=Anabas testudineus TaxID=64144 RepID=A0A3Q1J0D2_ANATE